MRHLKSWAGAAAGALLLAACSDTPMSATPDAPRPSLDVTAIAGGKIKIGGSATTDGNITGAIYTTDGCGTAAVNANTYPNQAAVFLNGGPRNGNGSKLPDGDYYVAVTASNGTVLGWSGDATTLAAPVEDSRPNQTVKVIDGVLVCDQLQNVVRSFSSGFTINGWDASGNGVYKVWISSAPDFGSKNTKTDNFRLQGEGDGGGDTPFSVLTVQKFYDANVNGLYDLNEVLLEGWKFSLTIDGDPAEVNFTTFAKSYPENTTYAATEFQSLTGTWYQTAPQPVPPGSFTGSVDNSGAPITLSFGNVCTGAGGGLTLGFWSNKNGQALVGPDDISVLVSLNLRNANGSNYDPLKYADFRTWILNATATNMAYMLSAQLAAMKLNVYNGFVVGTSMIYAPGTLSANASGFASVNAIMDEANTSLGTNGYTVASGTVRTYQEALKNALDKANNNLNFVRATPCAFSF